MSTDFKQLIADIEQEARAEGPEAMRELEQLREEFRLASHGDDGALGNNLGNKLRKTQEHPEPQTPVNTGSTN